MKDLGLWLALAKRGNRLPEIFVARACFPNVSQFCHTGSIIFRSKICFCCVGERYMRTRAWTFYSHSHSRLTLIHAAISHTNHVQRFTREVATCCKTVAKHWRGGKKVLRSVVQKEDKAIRLINRYLVDRFWQNKLGLVICPVDSVIHPLSNWGQLCN